MHNVYNNSWVTIAAIEANTSQDGFLHPRSEWKPVQMRARFDDNVFSDVLLFPRDLGSVCCRNNFPLFTRAWTMQETLLSSRIILYSPRVVSLLCLEDERCESGALPDVRHYVRHVFRPRY
ncbi:hypothetical protein C8035_v010727 [Colletotrichum spinosum]|uniref:Heterokaryon incompatibility domain-containing protein n=1 Tax=Colletotrichum spinosum TaxID=1347390 RepID=A0A4R8QJP3_9PEZI|nr:hypothetical protein C8035_v010727 [Colletotrichum spinosum]